MQELCFVEAELQPPDAVRHTLGMAMAMAFTDVR